MELQWDRGRTETLKSWNPNSIDYLEDQPQGQSASERKLIYKHHFKSLGSKNDLTDSRVKDDREVNCVIFLVWICV